MNKRKRWLLPGLLQENFQDTNLHTDLDFKVVLVERELIMTRGCSGQKRFRGDCIGVYETKDEMKRVPKNKYSYAHDLRRLGSVNGRNSRRRQNRIWARRNPTPNNEPSPESRPMELHYEVCYPRPKDISPWKQTVKYYPSWDREG